MAVTAKLHIVDYVIFIAVLVFSVGIGLYYAFTGGKQRTTKEYLMANRKLAVIPVGLSMFMSYFSAIYILGQTAETYLYGTQTWLSVFSTCLAYVLICQIFIPLFYPLKLTSAFEYVDRRFKSRHLRVTIAVCLILSQTVYMGVAMYAPGTALEAVTGFPLWASIIITGCVVTFYTTIGGMKAVVWTDVFQGVVMLVGLLAVLIVGSMKVGGAGKAWRIANEAGRVNFFNFDPDPTTRMTFWPLIFGTIFNILSGVGTAQAYVQRYCALPSMRAAKQAMLFNVILFLFLSLLLLHISLVVFAYYHELGCDPLRSGQISNSNQVLPYFVLNALNIPGLTGLFVSVLYSGALSSLSSVLSSLSAVTWKDILEQHFHHLPERRKALITKIIVFVFGCTGVGFAFLVNILSGHVMMITVRLGGSLNGPVKGIMLLGCLFPGAEWVGSIVGSVVSLGVTNWMNIGAYLTRPHRTFLHTTVDNCTFIGNTTAKPIPDDPTNVFWLYRVSFLWIAVIGPLICIIVGLIVSKFRKAKTEKIDPTLLMPLCDQLCCCLPKSIRKYFWCGTDFDVTNQQTEIKDEMQVLKPPEDDQKEVMLKQEMDLNLRGIHTDEDNNVKIPLVRSISGHAAGIYDVPNGTAHEK